MIGYKSDEPEDNEQLYQILDQINGVLFTGGNLTLINRETGEQHAYYKTAKKIIEYSMRQKQEHGIDFPILAICQGFEILGIVASGDDKGFLKDVPSNYEQRDVEWAFPTEKVCSETKLFSKVPLGVVEKMTSEKLTLHFHNYAIKMEDFEKSLKGMYKLISTDSHANGTKYVTAMEAYEYPFFSVLYHPEYNWQMKPCDETKAIAQGFTSLLHDYAHKHQEATLERAHDHTFKVKPISETMTFYSYPTRYGKDM